MQRAGLLLCATLLIGCGDDSSSEWTVGPATGDGGQDAPSADAAEEESPEASAADASSDAPPQEDAPTEDAPTEDAPDAAGELQGFIGSPCSSAADCKYAEAVCVTNGAVNGLCSLACTTSCPDQDGHPVTSCVEPSQVPEATSLPEGLCVSRCNFGPYPATGCREGYGCVKAARPGDPTTVRWVCVPNKSSDLPACYTELAARGVAFEPTVMKDESPNTHPNLTCHVIDPLYVESPVHGVRLESGGKETNRVLGSCRMVNALVSTADDLKPLDVIAIQHMGTYNCRVIAGTDKLSEHASGDAIDFGGFELAGGAVYTVVDDWIHDDDTPSTAGGKFLYEAAHRWYDQHIWNIILTPEYNSAHDNHFHVDMTDGSHFLGFTSGHYLGPNVYGD